MNLADNVRSGSLSTRSDRRIGVRKVNVVGSRKAQDVEQRVIQTARILGDSQVDRDLLRCCGANFLVESNENSVDRVLRRVHQVLTAPRHTRIVAHCTRHSTEGLGRGAIVHVVDRPPLLGVSNQGERLEG